MELLAKRETGLSDSAVVEAVHGTTWSPTCPGKGDDGLKPRERFLKAIRREAPDRVPLFIRYVQPVKDKLAPIFGATGRDLELKIGNDGVIVQIGINAEYSHRVVTEGECYTSEWGVEYRRILGVNQPVKHPLNSRKDLDRYELPNPNRPERMAEIKEVMQRYHAEYAVMVDLSCTLVEAAYAHLRGMEDFFCDLYEDPGFAKELLQRIATYYTELGKRAIEQGIDIIRIGDDIAGQTGLLISSKMWRQLAKPLLAGMIAEFRKTNPGIVVKYHSCGDFREVIPDLIELGVDLIGTMQPCGSMKPFELKREFGDRIAFLGGLDTQQLLPFGKPGEVREAVKELLRAYAPGGGYIFMPGHYVREDVPLENIWAMLETVKEYYSYPIKL